MPEASTASRVLPSPPQVDPGAFLGRAQELELIHQLLVAGPARLLTLAGPAGIGKTRLALEAAHRFGDTFPDGVWFVDLTALRDATALPAAVAQSLGLPDAGPTPHLEQLCTYLHGRETLLVLDNFEQILSAASQLDALLGAAPGLRLLVTSRELLHLRTEQTLPVPPFPLPDPEHLPHMERLVEIPSVALFVQRAQMINPGFRLTEENARAVAELVVQLDGLPLAIELAAARTQLLSPQMLLERLGQRLSLLHWEAQDLPVRQHTLRSAIAWSYDLLNEEEQTLFRSLGVFVGGFTLEAAEAVLFRGDACTIDMLEGLASLVDKSLVQREEDGEGAYRFRLLESVREFALEQITSCEAMAWTERAHARYFLELAERAVPELVAPRQREWFLLLEREHENLRAALQWLWEHGENEPALRLAAALGYFWEARGYLRQGVVALEKALAQAPDADPRRRARVLNRLGSLLTSQGEEERSRMALEEALELGRALEDAGITARALTHLGRRALDLVTPTETGAQASRLLEEALVLRQRLGDRRGAANDQGQLARIALVKREYGQAERLWREALATYREVGDEMGATAALIFLGMVAGEQGDIARTVALMRQALEAISHLRDRRLLLLEGRLLVWCLAGRSGDAEQMAMLLGAVEAMSDAIGHLPSGWRKTRTSGAAAELEGRLGKDRFEAAYREGHSLSFPQIGALLSHVLDSLEPGSAGDGDGRRATGGPVTSRALLSTREAEVLRLVAEGLTNKEIARRLVLTENTIKTHVTSLFNKLGVDSRAQAVAVAANEGLLVLTHSGEPEIAT